MKLLFLIAFGSLFVWYFWKGRDLLVRLFPSFAPIKASHDVLFVTWFSASRTMVTAFATQAAGLVITLWDVAMPLVSELTGYGLDLGEFFPGSPSAKFVGPALMVLGKLYGVLRKDTDKSLEEKKQEV